MAGETIEDQVNETERSPRDVILRAERLLDEGEVSAILVVLSMADGGIRVLWDHDSALAVRAGLAFYAYETTARSLIEPSEVLDDGGP